MSNRQVTNPTQIVSRQDIADFYDEIFPYLGGKASAGFTPVGTIISVMGVTAPANYLACDGTVYNISDYPELASYFGQQFSMVNKFGGNGTTTFAVPDLRGEFLRGTGTNSHSNGGNGSTVGTHQDPTYLPNVMISGSATAMVVQSLLLTDFYNNSVYGQDKNITRTSDGITHDGTYTLQKFNMPNTTTTIGTSVKETGFATRPTNTSVLYCIATKNIYMNPSLDYSTDEKVVGTWYNGKPLYQKTFNIDLSTIGAVDTTRRWVTVQMLSDLAIDEGWIVSGFMYKAEDGTFFSLNCTSNGTTEPISYNTIALYNPINSSGRKIHMLTEGTSFFKTLLGGEGNKLIVTIQYTKTT